MFRYLTSKLNIFKKNKPTKNEEAGVNYENPLFKEILLQAEKNPNENILKYVKDILKCVDKNDFKKLNKICANGLVDEIPLLRSFIWKINLGYFNGNNEDWDDIITKRREEYKYLKNAFSLKIKLEKNIFEENVKRQLKLSSKEEENEINQNNIKKAHKSLKRNTDKKLKFVDCFFDVFPENFDKTKSRPKSIPKTNNKNKIICEFNLYNDILLDSINNAPFSSDNIIGNIEKIIYKFNLKSIKNKIYSQSKKNKNSFPNSIDKENKKDEKKEFNNNTIINNKDRELIEDIYKDMRRTHSDFQFFLLPSNKKASQINNIDIENIIKRRNFNVSSLGFQTVVKEMNMEETHLDVIARILFIYSKTNTDLNYVQGMNEVCSLIYYVIVKEEILIKNHKLDIEKIEKENKINDKKSDIDYYNIEKGRNYSNENKNLLRDVTVNNEKNINLTEFSLKEFNDFETFLSYSERASKNSDNLTSCKINKIQLKNNFDHKNRNMENLNNENTNVIKSELLDLNSNKKLKNFQSDGDTKELNNLKIKYKFKSFLQTDYEADTYWCFTNIMEMLKTTYMRSQDEKENGIFKKIDYLKLALKKYDPILNKSLEDKNIDLGIFSLRWFILLYSQDFTLPDVIRIWDIILFIDDDTDIFFKVYIFSLAIITIKKSHLKKIDYVSFIMEMQNLYDINIEYLIETYANIYKNFSKKLKKILK